MNMKEKLNNFIHYSEKVKLNSVVGRNICFIDMVKTAKTQRRQNKDNDDGKIFPNIFFFGN